MDIQFNLRIHQSMLMKSCQNSDALVVLTNLKQNTLVIIKVVYFEVICLLSADTQP